MQSIWTGLKRGFKRGLWFRLGFRRGFRLGFVLCASLCAPSGVLHAMSLRAAYEAALRHDPAIRMAAQDRISGEQAAIVGRAALLPQVNYTASTAQNFNVRTQQTSAGAREEDINFRTQSDSLTLRQPLFSIDAFKRFQLGQVQAANAGVVFQSREQDLLLRLAEAYGGVLVAARQLETVDAQIRAAQEQRALSDRMFAFGEGTRTEVLESKARMELLQAARTEAVSGLEISRGALLLIVGAEHRHAVERLGADACPSAERCPVIRQLPAWLEEYRSEGGEITALTTRWLDRVETGNPELRAARNSIEQAGLELQRLRGQHAPRLDLTANLGRSSSESVLLLNQQFLNRGIGLQFNLPIYAGGAVSAQVAQAAAALERARIDHDGKRKRILHDIERLTIQIVQAMRRFEALKQSEASLELLVTATRKSVLGGYRIPLNVLEAQAQLAQTRGEMFRTLVQISVSEIRLRSLAGPLAADEFERYAPLL